MDFFRKAVKKLISGGGDDPRHFEPALNRHTPYLVPARASIQNQCATVISSDESNPAPLPTVPMLTAGPHAATHVLCLDIDETLSLCAVAVATETAVAHSGSPLKCHHSARQQQQAAAQQAQSSSSSGKQHHHHHPGAQCDIAIFHLQNPANVQWLLADDPTHVVDWKRVDDVKFIRGSGFLGVVADRGFFLIKIGADPSEAAFLHLSVTGQMVTALAPTAFPTPTLPSMFVGTASGNVLCAKVNRDNVSSISDVCLLSRSLTSPFFDVDYCVSSIVHSPVNPDFLLVAYCSAHDIYGERGQVAAGAIVYSITRSAPICILTANASVMPVPAVDRVMILAQSLCFDVHSSSSPSGSATDLPACTILGVSKGGKVMLWKNASLLGGAGGGGGKPTVLTPSVTHQLFGDERIDHIRLRPASVLPRQIGAASDAHNYNLHVFFVEHSIVRPATPAHSVYGASPSSNGPPSAAVSCVAVRVSGNGALTVATSRTGADVTRMLRSPLVSGIVRNEFAPTEAGRRSPVGDFWQAASVPPPANRPWIMTLFGGANSDDDGNSCRCAALDVFAEVVFDKKNTSINLVVGAPVERVAPSSCPPFQTIFPALPLLEQQQQQHQQQQQSVPQLYPSLILCTVSIPDGGAAGPGFDVLQTSHGKATAGGGDGGSAQVLLQARVRQDSLMVVSSRASDENGQIKALSVCRWSPSLDTVLGVPAHVPLTQFEDVAVFDSKTIVVEIVCFCCNGRRMFDCGTANNNDDDDDDDDGDDNTALTRPPPVVNSFLLLLRGRSRVTSELALFGLHLHFEADWRGYRTGAFRCLSTRRKQQAPPAPPAAASAAASAEEQRIAEKNAAVPLVDAPSSPSPSPAEQSPPVDEIVSCSSFRVWSRPAIVTAAPSASPPRQQPPPSITTVALVTHSGSLLSITINLPLSETSDVVTHAVVPDGVLPSRIAAVSNRFFYSQQPPPSQQQRQQVCALLTADVRIIVVDLPHGRIVSMLPLIPGLASSLLPPPKPQPGAQRPPFPLLPRRIDVHENCVATVEFDPLSPQSNIPRVFSFELFLPQEKQQEFLLVSRLPLAELHAAENLPLPTTNEPVRLIQRVSAVATGAPYDVVISARGNSNVVLTLLTPGLQSVKARLLLHTDPAAPPSHAAVAIQRVTLLGTYELHLLVSLSSSSSPSESHIRVVFQEPQKQSAVNNATLFALHQLADCCPAAAALYLPSLPDSFSSGQSRGAVRYGVPMETVRSFNNNNNNSAAASSSSSSTGLIANGLLPILPFEESAGKPQEQQQSKGFFSRLFSGSPSKMGVMARSENVLQWIHLRPGNWAVTKKGDKNDDADDFDSFIRHVAATTDSPDARANLMARVGGGGGRGATASGGRGGRVGAAGSAMAGAQSEMAEANERLRERGEHIQRVADRSDELANAGTEFARLSEQLAKQQKNSWF